MITRELCRCLNLATGASIQAKRVSAKLRLRAEASDKLERVLDVANENLAKARGLHQAALNDASKLRFEVRELRGLWEKYDEACLELSRIRSKHAEEMETVKKQFDEGRDRLKKDAAEESSRLNKMLGETEEKIRQLNHCVIARDDRIKWHQGKIAKLNNELSLSKEEANDKQSRINDLKERIEQVKANKLRAFGEVKELTERIARQEVEV